MHHFGDFSRCLLQFRLIRGLQVINSAFKSHFTQSEASKRSKSLIRDTHFSLIRKKIIEIPYLLRLTFA